MSTVYKRLDQLEVGMMATGRGKITKVQPWGCHHNHMKVCFTGLLAAGVGPSTLTGTKATAIEVVFQEPTKGDNQ